MKDFLLSLLDNNPAKAKSVLENRIKNLVAEKLNQAKLQMSAEYFGNLVEAVNVMKMGRLKMTKVRIRKGKIQRRKKASAVKGYTIRGGKLTRMSPLEKRHRKMAAVRTKSKRRGKIKQMLRKRSISLRKRGAMGL
jgi:hypothetical protein